MTLPTRQGAGFAGHLLTTHIGFAGNAVFGGGGQGEFLRQMAFVLDQLPQAVVYSRRASTESARSVAFPFSGSLRYTLFDIARRLPPLRRRRDWVTLVNDLDFDRRLAGAVEHLDLFDGISGQCAETFRVLAARQTKLVLTSLNTHIDYLHETLQDEHERVGFRERSFIHPRMRQRALQEIELADAVRVNSHWAKSTFVDRGVAADRIHVVHPGIDRRWFDAGEKADDVFRVLAISSIEPRKGIHYLLQAFEQARLPNAELVLIGATGDRWSHRMLGGFLQRHRNIRQRVFDIASAPVSASYGSASVLVHPAVEDGYALVIPQALAAGCPVIATRQSGASELIEHGTHGFVVERRDVNAIRNHLELLAGDPALLRTMRRAAPEAVAHLSYDAFARGVCDVYEKVLASAGRAGNQR